MKVNKKGRLTSKRFSSYGLVTKVQFGRKKKSIERFRKSEKIGLQNLHIPGR